MQGGTANTASSQVLIAAPWRAVLCDFGLAKIREQTVVNTTLGGVSPVWAAPEMSAFVVIRCDRVSEFARRGKTYRGVSCERVTILLGGRKA